MTSFWPIFPPGKKAASEGDRSEDDEEKDYVSISRRPSLDAARFPASASAPVTSDGFPAYMLGLEYNNNPEDPDGFQPNGHGPPAGDSDAVTPAGGDPQATDSPPPTASDASAQNGFPRDEHPPAPDGPQKFKILLATCEEYRQRLGATKRLEARGYTVRTVSSREECLDAFSAEFVRKHDGDGTPFAWSFDMIILHCELQDALAPNIPEFPDQIREIEKMKKPDVGRLHEVPIFIMCSSMRENFARRLRDDGYSGWVRIPIYCNWMVKLVDSVVDEHLRKDVHNDYTPTRSHSPPGGWFL